MSINYALFDREKCWYGSVCGFVVKDITGRAYDHLIIGLAKDKLTGAGVIQINGIGNAVVLKHGHQLVERNISFVSLSALYNYCLLYTSPSPRDKRQSRMPSSA